MTHTLVTNKDGGMYLFHYLALVLITLIKKFKDRFYI